jgi:hypothetical protein
MRKSGWTPERRAKQSEAVRGWQPWNLSTGPRTDKGKARSSRNADKGIAAMHDRILKARLEWRAAREAEANEACRLLFEVRQ